MKKALFIGAHTDDIEMGCGGYIQRFETKMVVVFSPAIESIPTGFPNDTTKNEFENSCSKINCESKLYEIPVRNFDTHRQFILEELVKIKKEYRPDIVFTHSSSDIHQDHQVIYEESIRAFRDISILGYNIWSNNNEKKFNYFIELSDIELGNKIDFMSCYKSQLAKKDYLKIIKINAEYFGMLLGKKYVENYELIRWIE